MVGVRGKRSMPDLVPIGRFAALSGLTVKALRLYDIRGVLYAADRTAGRAALTRHRRRIEEHIDRHRRALTILQALEGQWATSLEGGHMADQTTGARESKPYRCSFCGKDNAEVRRLIAGPNGVFICDERVARCNEILAKEEARA